MKFKAFLLRLLFIWFTAIGRKFARSAQLPYRPLVPEKCHLRLCFNSSPITQVAIALTNVGISF